MTDVLTLNQAEHQIHVIMQAAPSVSPYAMKLFNSGESLRTALQAARAALRELLMFAPNAEGNAGSGGGTDSLLRWKQAADAARAALGEEA